MPEIKYEDIQDKENAGTSYTAEAQTDQTRADS